MICLSVNLNKMALIRNSRITDIPNLVDMAQRVIRAGAHGITVHPRPDQRHIRPQDVYDLENAIDVELNIEGNPFAKEQGSYPGFLEIVRQAQPAQCTLVPDSETQLTSDHGWALDEATCHKLRPIIEELKAANIRVSLFMDPDLEAIQRAQAIGADRIELYTGPFAEHYPSEEADNLFKLHSEAAELAHEIGLGVNAGHDLNLHNLPQYAKLPHLAEVSIGHALTCDALLEGLDNTIRNYLSCLKG